jgi:hypothetical protein
VTARTAGPPRTPTTSPRSTGWRWRRPRPAPGSTAWATSLGFLAFFAALDNPTSNDKTREVLGWEPTHIGWIEDVQTGHYID